MNLKNNKKRYSALFILILVISLVAMSTVIAFADTDEDDESNYFVGSNTTGYDLVAEPLVNYVYSLLNPAALLFTAIGGVYSVILGVKFAKSEDEQGRAKVKQAMRNLIVGMITFYVVFVVLKLSLPIFADYATDVTKDLDKDNLVNQVDNSQSETGQGINTNSEYAESIEEMRKQDKDNNYIPPTTTEEDDDEDDGLGVPPETNVNNGDNNLYEDVDGSNGGSGMNTGQTVDKLTSLQNAQSEWDVAYADYSADPAGSKGSTPYYTILKSANSALKTALAELKGELGSGTPTDSQSAAITKAEQSLNTFDSIDEA